MYCDSGLGGWAALCREASHDTAMPARTHGHDTGAGRRCWALGRQGVHGRWADGRCRQLGARARGVAGARAWGVAGVRACGANAQGARQAGRAAGRASERQAGRAACARAASARARGACAAGREGRAVGALLGARSLRGTGAVHAAMHGQGVAWALDGCAGWASWASFGAQCTWLSSGSVSGPGSTRYFPESPNEHCSL